MKHAHTAGGWHTETSGHTLGEHWRTGSLISYNAETGAPEAFVYRLSPDHPEETHYSRICVRGSESMDPDADAALIALAPTAPHDCDIPGCPGAENKRRLEAFGRLLSTLDSIAEKAELLRENALAEGHSWEADDAESIRNQARAAVAKAQDAKVG